MNKTSAPQMAGSGLKDRIREIVGENAGLKLPLGEIKDSTDLYRAGMTSYSSVLLMVSLENEFNIEFADSMLSRDVFESVESIAHAIESLLRAES
jgi:acyl carrier protein